MNAPSADALRSYQMTADALFGVFRPNVAMHRDTMSEMVQRYDIKGKRVLGVGPGDSAQEYWFHAQGNSLFLIDIDENGALEPMLRSVAVPHASPETMTYVIGDARHVSEWLNARFDVIFTSGFTPDEAHRAATLAAFGGRMRGNPDLQTIGAWPPDVGPLSQLCEEIITGGLNEGGLFVMLSYASGPDVLRAKNYVPALEAQFGRLGLSLIEMHCLASTPGVHLVVAQKSADGKSAAELRAKLGALAPLSAMHARTTLDHTALRVIPGPVQIGRSGSAGVSAAEKSKLDATVGAALDRFAPSAKSVFYAGDFQETEGFYMLGRGLAATFGWGSATRVPRSASRDGLVHASLTTRAQATAAVFDLCFLSFPAADDAKRAEAATAPATAPRPALFDADTLEDAQRTLEPGAVLIYQGRSGGIDPLHAPDFVDAIRDQLEVAGFQLDEMYVMREAPGMFLFAARRQPAVASPARPEPTGMRIVASTLIDNTAVRVWPRAVAQAASN